MMNNNSKNKNSIDHLVDAMDDIPIAEEDAREVVAKLGIDVKVMAAGLRSKVAARKRIDEAREAYGKEIERLEKRRTEPKRTREEELEVFQSLLARAQKSGGGGGAGAAVAMHFLKYESASDDELSELIRSLRHLLGDDEQ